MIRRIPRPHRRKGYSLVEVVIVAILASAVLSIGIGTLHLLLRSETAMTDALQRSQTVSQLARSFRKDVHAARSAEVLPPAEENQPANESRLRVELADDHQVVYATNEHSITRTETQGNETLQSARFRFSPGSSIALAQEDDPARVVLTIHSPQPSITRTRRGDRTLPTRELKIRADVGRDHRFETSQP